MYIKKKKQKKQTKKKNNNNNNKQKHCLSRSQFQLTEAEFCSCINKDRTSLLETNQSVFFFCFFLFFLFLKTVFYTVITLCWCLVSCDVRTSPATPSPAPPPPPPPPTHTHTYWSVRLHSLFSLLLKATF